MQVRLIVVEGRARERELVRELPIVIGRSRAAGVTVGDPKVSRQHCFLEEQGGMVMLRDNGSLNGTLIDGQRVEGEAVIRPGARLTVGPLTFVLIYEPTGEEVQAETARMSPARACGPDLEALVAGSDDDAEAEGATAGDAAGYVADVPKAPVADEATIQWLPPLAASGAHISLPPPSSTPAAKAEPQRPEPAVEFGWLAEAQGAGAAGRDEPPATISDSNGDDADGDAGPGETEDLPAGFESASGPAEGLPGRKRAWWPFGKKKPVSTETGAEPAAALGSIESAPQVVEAPDEEEAPRAPAAPLNEEAPDDTVGPASETVAVKDPSVSEPQQVPAAEAPQPRGDAQGDDDQPGAGSRDDEDDFNQFLKGLQ
jgi:FHA domain